MRRIIFLLTAIVWSPVVSGAPSTAAEVSIVCPTTQSAAVVLAARELQRYVYQRTGLLPAIVAQVPVTGDVLIPKVVSTLQPQQYKLQTRTENDRNILEISGGTGTAVLYGVYRFAEKLGVRFYLDEDVIPDRRVRWRMPIVDEQAKPLFALRGIQPFHDFTEGPDWWSADDYKAYLSQMVKLRMNWLGLHCYPEGGVGPEPLIWIGLAEDVAADGTVKFSYPSRWASTEGGAWGYGSMKTSSYCAGASLLFEVDDYGPEVTKGYRPKPTTLEGSNTVFNRTGKMLHDVFSFGHLLGIKFCIGTETPLTIPKAVQKHLKAKGLDPAAPKTVQRLYTGMFTRIKRAYPIDYYWLWTPEGWTWSGVKQAQIDATIADVQTAFNAIQKVEAPFGFATCGWVLGPPNDRGLFAKVLPKSVALSCINRQVGFAPVEPGFAQVKGRGKWAIPWLEDDPALIIPQLWVGRMRRDAADAYRYGCTGLMGIHWRTKVLSPNIAALADAAWRQATWNRDFARMSADSASDTNKRSADRPRDLPCRDFYNDWCRVQFGPAVGAKLADLFSKLDGGPNQYGKNRRTFLPRPATWMHGPGGIAANKKPWKTEQARYAFVDQFQSLRSEVRGAGNLARFDYWLNTFRYLRAVGRLGCLRGELDRQVARIRKQNDPQRKKQLAEQALAVRVELARQWEKMMSFQIAVVSTPGELGTIANLEQHVRSELHFLDAHDKQLAQLLGHKLPNTIQPSHNYHGAPHLIVPTKRTQVYAGERLVVKVLAPAAKPPLSVVLYWRRLGHGRFHSAPCRHAARAVYQAVLPPAESDSLEYYVEGRFSDGLVLHWPPTAPNLNHTVVVLPKKP